MMKVRKFHRVIGLIMLTPFLEWAPTGFFFREARIF
jgi:hypothetical protein